MNVYLPNLRLPSEYQEVEYIGRNGNNYIDTGWVPKLTAPFEVKVGCKISTSGVRYGVLSNYNGTSGEAGLTSLEINDGSHTNNVLRFYSERNSGSNSANIYSSNTLNLSSFNDIVYTNNGSSSGSVTLNGITTNGSVKTDGYSNLTAYLFIDRALRWSTYSNNSFISYCKIYENGTLVRDFVPCYRKSDSVIGLYDLVNNTFYTNAGTGTFSKGNDVTIAELKNAYIGELWTPGDNTLLYLPMKDDLNDHSSNHFTLTNTGVSLVQNQANIQVGYFNGSSYLSGANSNLLSFGDIHLGAWIKINQFNNAQFILSGISSGNIFLGFEYSSARKRIGIGRNGVAWDSYFSITLSTNTWYYLSFDRQGSSLNIYINNTSLGTATNNISYNTSGGYQIGNDGTGNYVNGYISNLILENKARTAEEISDYYNITKYNYGL